MYVSFKDLTRNVFRKDRILNPNPDPGTNILGEKFFLKKLLLYFKFLMSTKKYNTNEVTIQYMCSLGRC